MRASPPTLVAASRAIATQREAMLARWSEWLGERLSTAPVVGRDLVEHELGVILDVLTVMVGPLRREVKHIWSGVADHYGRLAATRGLAAGEGGEELQYLRELLIRYLAPAIAARRPRQGMALLLRLNRLVDKGVAAAVAGYTDVLVSGLIARAGDDPSDETVAIDPDAVRAELEDFARALQAITGNGTHGT